MVAIEIDPVLVQYLRAEFRDEPRLTLVEADVLKANLAQWGAVAVAGNLPYYITSPILEKTLRSGRAVDSRGVPAAKRGCRAADRTTGTRDYGFLSVQTQLLSTPELLFTVPAAAFRPPPKVDSAVVRMLPNGRVPRARSHGVSRFRRPLFPPQAQNNSQQFVGKLRSRLLGCDSRNGPARRTASIRGVRRNCSAEWWVAAPLLYPEISCCVSVSPRRRRAICTSAAPGHSSSTGCMPAATTGR